jgi:plastocyanin
MLLRPSCGRTVSRPLALIAGFVALGLVHGLAAAPAPIESGRTEPGPAHSVRGELGRIAGRVRLGIRPAARPLSTDSYSRQINAVASPTSELANVLVWIKDAAHVPAGPPVHAELRQRGEMYVPHVVAIPTGSTVSFPNDDALFHNVFSLSRAGTFDLGRYPQGETRTRRFDKAGVIKVYCHLHSHMSAIIAVFDHPWFAQAGADGSFVIDRVPAGRYVLTGWHERAGNTDQPVTVEAGATARVELLVPIEP